MISGRVDVFVSYRHHASSTPWVREVLVPALELAGFSVVIDVRDFPPGAVVMSEMEVASTHARVTVAVIDETYADGGFVEAERHLATRLIAVRRADVGDHVAVEAALTVDATATDDPASVVDAVRQLIRRVFVLEAPDDTEWVNGVLLPTLDRTDASAESCGGLVAGEQWTDAVFERLVRADRVVIVLSRAYLREVHPRAGTLVAHVEAEEHRAMALPLRREADVEVPALLRTREIIDASRDELWDAALERLCAAVGVPLPPTEGPPPCPYPGMRPFGEGEHDHFFGRDREIEEVLGALRRRRFVAIIGPSASGKSSLARAGVAPALVARGRRDGESWMVQVVRPGARPLETLGAVAKAWREARRDPTGGARRLLLIIDQLEELYAPDVEGREELEREVAHLVSDEGDLHVVVTVRADFYPQVMSGALWPLVSANRVEVVPLRGAGLRAAIREPARGRGVVVAEALVERLAGETEGQPGLLPFLQETLVTLWGSLRHRLLTVEAYERLGDDSGSGVLQAIRREATAAVGEICARYPDGEQVVRGIMLRLVQFGEGRPHTRRRLPIDALRGAASDDAAFTAVFDTLVAHRLITVEGEPQSPQYADLSHEAIIRGWPDLARWIEERQATEAARRRLLEDTRSWEERTEQGHPELGLLESLDLADAERWRQSADAKDLGIDPAINRFIDASAARAASRRRRRRLSIVAVIAALSLVALVLAFATVQARRAQHEAERASRQRLALQLRSASGDQGLSLRALLVRAADRLEPDQLSLVEMLTTAESERFIATRIDSPGTKVGLDAMWIDDQVAIAGAGDGTVYVWPMTPDGPDLLSRKTFEVGRTPLAMAREPGTDLLAIGAGNGSPEAGSFPGSRGGVELVDLGQAELKPRSLGLSGDSPASALAFVGTTLVVGRWDGTVTLVDVANPQTSPRILPIPEGPPNAVQTCVRRDAIPDRKVRAVAVDSSGRWLAAGANNCVIAIWDLQDTTWTPQRLADHTDKVRTLEFLPGTTSLISSGDDRSIRLWRVAASTGPSTLLAAGADEQRVIDLCVSPDGSSVVAAGRDHKVHRWRFVRDVLVSDPTALIGHASTIRDVQCLSSSRFVSLGGDGLVVWDLNRPARTGRTLDLTGHGLSSVTAVAVRPGVTHDVAVAAVHEPTGTGGVVVSTPQGADRLLDLGGVFPLALAYSPNGAYLAVAGNTSALAGWVGLYDAERLTPIFAGPAAELATLRAVAVVDAEHWAVGSDAGKFEVHDGDAVGHNTVESGFGVTSLAYAPDGRLIVGDSTGFLSCYDPTDLGRVLGQRALGRAIPSIAVGENGVVAVGTHDGVVAIYPHAFGAGGATNGSDCDPSAWTQTGIAVESDAAHSVALAARGQLLAAGTNDGTVELLDVKRTRRIGTLTIDWDGAPASVSMDSDATTIAVGAGNHVEVYALDRDLLRSYLCKLAGRDLTEDERAVFLPEGTQQEAARC